jgi:thioredoxin 1
MPLDIKEQEFDKKVLEASKTKPILVDFWAPWCGPCLMMAPILDEVAKDLGEKGEIIKVNVDNCQQVASTYGIRSIPTLILFKNGEAIKTEVGLKNKNVILDLFK